MTNTLKIKEWIDQQLANDPPRAKSLVMTVFGDAIAPHGGAIWLGSLISLMNGFGINERLVRTSVFRLVEETWLEARRDGRRSSYRLAPVNYARLQHAYARVYSPEIQGWDQNWTLVIISNDDSVSSGDKVALKKELHWEGFRMISDGILAHPQANIPALQEILERINLSGQLIVCHVKDCNKVNGRPLSSLVATHWQLTDVNASYQRFIASFSPLSGLLNGQELADNTSAFVIRSLLIHDFRRAQLHDPHLPATLRPKEWMGEQAYQLCAHLYQLCLAPSEEILKQALEQEYRKGATVRLQHRFKSPA